MRVDRNARTNQVRDEEEDVLVRLLVFHFYGLLWSAIALGGDPLFGRHAC